ncbi:FAD-dependent oxidoreductase [Aporhodopirellula aestuarii]|uniref:NAD(P)-binding protein n=1 Tax=Aporhodopirellula aestuarii TaxID=2950107 RepID=A0ABT0U434_9BACT|nr:FAD-dependent oxidoreductase [Aporhodopirellula aestuarii]MCM2371683.1 NAD(P)-binding protein [Aporhodopirellula aestuarii]
MDQQLPTSLSERCQWCLAPEQTNHAPGEFVLYWMHNALRAHENPALDVAEALARQNGLPLLIYHGLSEKYPYASDRHHAFILQGARDVQREMAAAGYAYVFHLERAGHRGAHLRDLARLAAVVVTEAMPVAPLVQWTERLRCITKTPIVSVDTTCLVPLSVVADLAKKRHSKKNAAVDLGDDLSEFDLEQIEPWVCRAFRYRDLTAASYDERVARPYDLSQAMQDDHVDASELPEPYVGPLGFEPLDLQDACLARLIGQCKIDHTIAPVPDSPGGSRAGYARWEAFQENGLHAYDQRRNDSADPLGGSRLSAYLHYGMISPFRIAREAFAASGNTEADGENEPAIEAAIQRIENPAVKKFLDEFLIWREMSFHFCELHTETLDTLDACPDWASESLRKHADDEREQTHDWETLARGKTQQTLWDAAQRSLLRHGELHNNLRMTWGKAFLPMTKCPEQALCSVVDLNHRYALDGRSPASYGGILWCFGQFDRPFAPESPVFGVVRTRSVAEHENRLDVKRFSDRCDRPIAATLPRVAVIGAGIGGLMAARTLADHGLDVRVFDKSRGVGGRMATRRGDGIPSFDHGAQYFTVRDDRFARYVRSWIASGKAASWMGRIVELRPGGEIVAEKRSQPRFVGLPAMNSIAKHLASDLDVTLGCRVAQLVREADAWDILDESGESRGQFDLVVTNCPPQQSAPLLQGHTELADVIAGVEMVPCWTLMIHCDGLDDLPFAGAFVNEGPLRWIARNDAKPGRAKSTPGHASSWVLHASEVWSAENLEADAEWVRDQMIHAFELMLGRKLGQVHHAVTHRWRYANTREALPQNCLWDPSAMLGACGDWCGGPRVEGAFLSGAAIAGAILRRFTVDRPAADSHGTIAQQCMQ